MKKFVLPIKTFAFFLLCISSNAYAAETQAIDIFNTVNNGDKKLITNLVVVDFTSNDTFHSSNRAQEYSDTSARLRFVSSIKLNNKLSIHSQFAINPIYTDSYNQRRDASPNGGGNRSFENEGLVANELYLKYREDKYTLLLGKMNLNYGSAWRWDRGIWTYELANEYRQVGKITTGAVYHLGNAKTTGQYNFNFNFFKNDRKYLDNSLFVKNDIANKSQAQAGDDNLLKSYMASLDIKFDFGEKEKLTYNFGYIKSAVNEQYSLVPSSRLKDQNGIVLGMNYKYPVRENYDIDALIEYSKMNNLNGDAALNERYFTANIINKLYNNWLITAGYSSHSSNLLQRNGYNQKLAELSFGYEFNKTAFFDRFIIQTGYKNMQNDFKTNVENRNTLGLLIRYYKSF
jgi:hypothetical protein